MRTVKSLGDTVGCTITVHHLALVVDDWASNSHNYCKPVAKTPEDRAALRDIVKEGEWSGQKKSDAEPGLLLLLAMIDTKLLRQLS